MFPWRLKNGSLAQNKMFRPHEPNPDVVPSAHPVRGESALSEVERIWASRTKTSDYCIVQRDVLARFLIRVMPDAISS